MPPHGAMSLFLLVQTNTTPFPKAIIGKTLGEETLAAVGVTFPLFTIFLFVLMTTTKDCESRLKTNDYNGDCERGERAGCRGTDESVDRVAPESAAIY